MTRNVSSWRAAWRSWKASSPAAPSAVALLAPFYEDQLLNLAFQGKYLRNLVVPEVMSKPLPQVPRTAPVERVTHILSHENPAVFVEMGNGHFEILTKYDLMSTVASLMEQKR